MAIDASAWLLTRRRSWIGDVNLSVRRERELTRARETCGLGRLVNVDRAGFHISLRLGLCWLRLSTGGKHDNSGNQGDTVCGGKHISLSSLAAAHARPLAV
ncbi:protein of unknown function (plasmid) [Paraburkholderia dioscoreae]|uniref:Uncharacterized protein n=1 Tax=Paraburkholderia dioscoreae TaxID=2604047 RepID=A0A5Q4YWR0_9BURK|nr:protein of unknown function [Paraburkholderia dioscoreae]